MFRLGKSWEPRSTCIALRADQHDMKAVMGVSDRITVMNFDRKIAEGSLKEIASNETVIEAYLGKEDIFLSKEA